jgi:deoxyribonuclease-4
MPTHSNLLKTVQLAHSIGCETIQIFASNPTGWSPPPIDVQACEAFAQAAREADLQPMVIHAPYLINLGSSDEANREKSRTLLSWTLSKASLLGVRYVVFHTGSHRGAGLEVGIDRVVNGIRSILAETPEDVMLLLENDVGAGDSIGSRFENLAAILERLPDQEARLGVCLDTAHLWGAGYEIATEEGAKATLDQFCSLIAPERLHVMHLNDTEKALGSRRDVHARLGEGLIQFAGLQALLTDPRIAHAVAIMETPIPTNEQKKEDWSLDAHQVELAKKLVRGEADNPPHLGTEKETSGDAGLTPQADSLA